MVYAEPFLRVTAQGSAWGGAESWSCGWNMVPNFEHPTDTITQPTDLLPFWTAISAWFTRTTSRISTVAKLEMVKVNVIGVDGKYADANQTFLYEPATPVSGANGSAAAAPQLSACISLVTDATRGPGSKGRFYPPCPVVFAEGDGLITAADAQGMADSAATLITALNGCHDYDVGVASAVGAGSWGIARSVRVGRVIDTIRRRRSALVESYVAGPAIGNFGVQP